MSRKLFDISADLLALDSLLDELEGDVSDPAADAAITAWFEELHSEQAEKLDGYVLYIRRMESEAAAACAMKEQYATHERVRLNRVKWMKERMRQYVEAAGGKDRKLKTSSGLTLAVQKNGGTPALEIEEGLSPAAVATVYTKSKLVVSFDTDKIREDLEAGELIPWATVKPVGTHLRIR